MIYELIRATNLTASDVLEAIGVEDPHDVAWPLPNAEKVSPAAYWNLFMEGPHKALIEAGIRSIDGRSCKLFIPFDERTRGGLAVAVDIHTREATFFSWSQCEHLWAATHEHGRSGYRCTKCGLEYSIDAEV